MAAAKFQRSTPSTQQHKKAAGKKFPAANFCTIISLMVYFRKRLTPEILGEINEMVLMAQDANKHDDSNNNSGTMIVDAMCAPSQIQYPQDTALLNEARENLETIRKVYEQQKSMYDARNHTVSDRIVSSSQPWLHPIVRGKAKASVEFGAKLDISVVNGWTRLEVYSFDAYNEAGGLAEMIER